MIDEAHVQMSVWVNKIKDCSAHVIGLSATPFSDGLGKLFSNLVCASSMHALTESGVLVPMRVFPAPKVDMRAPRQPAANGRTERCCRARHGNHRRRGDLNGRNSPATGRRLFSARPSRTAKMARQFNAAGVMAACFTSDTSEVERKPRCLMNTAKPDSVLRVLLSVSALAKGFDVQDVGCVCDVRPLRKSLSEAIQMWGAG